MQHGFQETQVPQTNLQCGYGVMGLLLSLKCEQNAIEYIEKWRNSGVLLEGSLESDIVIGA